MKKSCSDNHAGIMHKKSILKKTIEVGSSTMLSRVLGIVRELLTVKFLGVGAISDAFFTAYKIPNSLRKIFAEGALSAAMVPTIVSIIRKKDKESVNKLMALAFLVFEGTLLLLCALAIWQAPFVVWITASGFSPEKIAFTAKLLQILMPFIFFISSSALLAGPLQSVGHFFIPAISPALLNIVFIASLLFSMACNLSIEYLCYFILLGGFLQLVLHLLAYVRLGFSFQRFDADAWRSLGRVMLKFVPCVFSMTIVEVSFLVDTWFASWLPEGSVSLIYYANRFMGIPLGVFGVALSTILLPHFSKLRLYAPKRIQFYLLEASKFVFWVVIPVVCMMIFFSEKIFSTFFLSKKFNVIQVSQAGTILIAFLFGLFFFSLNKILLNIYYAFHNMWIPTLVSLIATVTNIGMNIIFMKKFMAAGIALATSVSAVVQTILFLLFLAIFFDLRFYVGRFLEFLVRYVAQLCIVFTIMYFVYHFMYKQVALLPEFFAKFFLDSIGFWVWVGPLGLLTFILIYYTRKWFKVKLYFLD